MADVRLTTVIAPAGWGKTTLLAAWARGDTWGGRVGWLSVDEADDDPVRFWTYALSALSKVAPHLTEESLAALKAPGMDAIGVALAALLNALTTTEDSHALVLDDYHVLRDPTIHQGVEFLLTYLPPALHLVIAGRTDPPLPLARMRARGELNEIRVADLRCTADWRVAFEPEGRGGTGAQQRIDVVASRTRSTSGHCTRASGALVLLASRPVRHGHRVAEHLT